VLTKRICLNFEIEIVYDLSSRPILWAFLISVLVIMSIEQ